MYIIPYGVMMAHISNAICIVFISAYVTTLIVENPHPEFAIASIAAASISFVAELQTWRVVHYVWETGIPYVVIYACMAYAGNVLTEFAISYVTSCIIIVWILVAQRVSIVLYDANSASFVFTRCSLYAALRASLVFTSRRWSWLTTSRTHIVLLAIPTTETIAMWLGNNRSYRYDRSHTMRTTYALIKACVFAVLPILDEFIYARV